MAETNRPPLWLAFAVIVACIAAVADWPYGYYQLLRLAVTGYAVWVAVCSWNANRQATMWVFIFIAVLYNPVFKISMERSTHEIVNYLTVFVIAIELFKNRKATASPPQQ